MDWARRSEERSWGEKREQRTETSLVDTTGQRRSKALAELDLVVISQVTETTFSINHSLVLVCGSGVEALKCSQGGKPMRKSPILGTSRPIVHLVLGRVLASFLANEKQSMSAQIGHTRMAIRLAGVISAPLHLTLEFDHR